MVIHHFLSLCMDLEILDKHFAGIYSINYISYVINIRLSAVFGGTFVLNYLPKSLVLKSENDGLKCVGVNSQSGLIRCNYIISNPDHINNFSDS